MKNTAHAAVAALIRKDLVLYFSNRRAVLMSLVAPILIAAFFGYLFGSGSRTPGKVGIALVDLDRSALSASVLGALRNDAALDVRELPPDAAAAQVAAGKLTASITLPAGFGAQAAGAMFGAADKPQIALQVDPSQSMALQLVRGLLAQHVTERVAASAFSSATPVYADLRERTLNNEGLPAAMRADLAEMFTSIERVQRAAAPGASSAAAAPGASSAGALPSASSAAAAPGGSPASPFSMPYTLREQEAGQRTESRYNSYAHAFAGMGVQFVLLMGVDLGIGLLAMRRLDLWKRLRAAPLSRGALLGSRIGSTALIALIVLAVVYAAAVLGFGVRIDGSALGFAAVLVSFALMTASFGLLIAALGRTPEATRGLAILATLMLVMLGGAWVPAFAFPAWLQSVSLAVPTRWAVDGLDAMTWRGLPLADALPSVAALLGFSALFGALAFWRFDWQE